MILDSWKKVKQTLDQVLKPKNGISIPLEWKRFTKIDFVGEFKEANFEKPNFAWEFIFK